MNDEDLIKKIKEYDFYHDIELKEGMGYEFEIRSFVDEILSGKESNLVLLNQAAESIAIIEAEQLSIKSCSVVTVKV